MRKQGSHRERPALSGKGLAPLGSPSFGDGNSFDCRSSFLDSAVTFFSSLGRLQEPRLWKEKPQQPSQGL